VEMPVEICLLAAKFSGFLQNMRVYDDLPISQPRVQVQTGQGFSVNRFDSGCCLCPEASGRKMRRNQQRLLGLGISILVVITLCPTLLGQASSDSEVAGPLITDWSYHHVIFSKPATAEQAKRVEQDPRYWQQFRRQAARPPDAETGGGLASELQPLSNGSLPAKNQELGRDWSQDMGSSATVGATNYPAKYSFHGFSANCANATQPDFVVYGTGLVGSATQASVVAYDNLYSGCSGFGTVPIAYWAYDTLGGTIVTSPVFSRDGTQVAFVQAGGGFKSTLVLLKWAASAIETASSPLSLTRTLRGSYSACTAPCMTTLTLSDSSGTVDQDSNSSVFYDYTNDIAYVGDDSGWLHKFTPFFKGLPTEVRTGGWPVQVNPGAPTALNSPVHDFASGNVFVTDVGGFLYLVDSTTAAVTISGQLDFSSLLDSGPGIVQGPIVDSTAGLVYVFAASDGTGGCLAGADCSAIFQLSTSFIASDTGAEQVVGKSTVSGSAPSPLYLGAFDSSYENSVTATGNLYVCGNTGGVPTLYQVSIVGGVLTNISTGVALSNSTTPCSPVSDVLNPNASGGATEWVFVGSESGGISAGCTGGGCIFNFKDTQWKASTTYTAGQEVFDSHQQIQVVSAGGTSGAAAPAWSTIVGKTTTDGTLHWLNQGPLSAVTPAAWVPTHLYTKGKLILDGNNNIELVTTAGNSGATIPTFRTTVAGITGDGAGTLKWTNVGAPGTAALAATGGTSGIVIDNTVGSGTLAGASQVYFSTLSNQACDNGTGGCAVQASQSALK
jgi:hypothetical protein